MSENSVRINPYHKRELDHEETNEWVVLEIETGRVLVFHSKTVSISSGDRSDFPTRLFHSCISDQEQSRP